MMSLALLPIGLIAIIQTRTVSEKALRNAELALLALVEQSALSERLSIQRALGVADSIASIAPDLLADGESCARRMREIASHTQRFSFVGLLPNAGQVTCSSAARPFDVSESDAFDRQMRVEDNVIRVNARAPISQTAVINVSVPYYDGNKMAGRASVSIPHSSLESRDESDVIPPDALKDLVTFTELGDILTLHGDPEFLNDRLPIGLNLANMIEPQATVFSSLNRAGEPRIYTVVPIEKQQLYVLGIWDAEASMREHLGSGIPAIVFPGLMWLTSLVVVLLAVHRLVSRHVWSLRRQMGRFARDRALIEPTDTREMPTELLDIYTGFTTMAYSIMQDEARLENALREKNVLLREVHHRVKNNLQLISSIVNMQIRNSPSADTRASLRRIQDRVLSLATIHRDLYQTSTAGLVNVGNLIRDIIEKSAEIGTENGEKPVVNQDIDDIMLYPDQAVPMSLLAAEATTNAMKYASTSDGSPPQITVSLKALEGKKVVFELINSASGEPEAEGTGMGAKLIKAFSIQLGAEIEYGSDGREYRMTVTFEAADFVPQAETY